MGGRQAGVLPAVRRPPAPGSLQPLRLPEGQERRVEGEAPEHRAQERPPRDAWLDELPQRGRGPGVGPGAQGPHPAELIRRDEPRLRSPRLQVDFLLQYTFFSSDSNHIFDRRKELTRRKKEG